VSKATKTELMSPNAQNLPLDDHMVNQEQEIEEQFELEIRQRNVLAQYERLKPEVEREIHEFVLQMPSKRSPGYYDNCSEFIPIQQRQCKWEECSIEHLMPGFAPDRREWRPVLLEDEEIGKTKGFRLVTEYGKYSEIYLARLVFLHHTPFTRRWRHDKTVDFTEQFYYLFCHTHDTNRTAQEHNKQQKEFESNRSIKTKTQFATILQQAHQSCDKSLEEIDTKKDTAYLGLDMSDSDDDDEKENTIASEEAANENFEVELGNFRQLSSPKNKTVGLEVSDEEDEDDENVDGKQARKEWNRRQKAMLLNRLAKNLIYKHHLKNRRDQAKDELDLLSQTYRHSEIDQRIEDPEYKCGTCHRTLDSVEGVPKEAHEAICADTRRYLENRRN